MWELLPHLVLEYDMRLARQCSFILCRGYHSKSLLSNANCANRPTLRFVGMKTTSRFYLSYSNLVEVKKKTFKTQFGELINLHS